MQRVTRVGRTCAKRSSQEFRANLANIPLLPAPSARRRRYDGEFEVVSSRHSDTDREEAAAEAAVPEELQEGDDEAAFPDAAAEDADLLLEENDLQPQEPADVDHDGEERFLKRTSCSLREPADGDHHDHDGEADQQERSRCSRSFSARRSRCARSFSARQ